MGNFAVAIVELRGIEIRGSFCCEGPLNQEGYLTNRATENNPSLPHPEVTTRRLRLTRSQLTFATTLRTTHVSTRNRRNRMYSFDRGAAHLERRRFRDFIMVDPFSLQ